MNMQADKILDFCLLIPCYNNFEGLVSSLQSVVYREGKYLVLIIDDGSDDPLEEEKVKARVGNSQPLEILFNKKNIGITHTLNKGLSWIVENTYSKYIARLDCGDNCTIDRFILQVEYLDLHPETGLIGSWCKFEDKKTSERYSYVTPVTHHKIQKSMYLRNVFIHPSVMFRTSLLEKTGYYPESFTYAEDYAFFWKFLTISKGHVMDKFLVTCEISKEGISYTNRRKQLIARYKVVRSFSRPGFLKIFGVVKLLVLYIMPGSFILRMKKIIT